MVGKLEKSCILVLSLLVCSSLVYSEDSPEVVLQPGYIGTTSISDQNLEDQLTLSTSSNSSAKLPSVSGGSTSEKKILLKLQQQVENLQSQLKELKSEKNNSQFENMSGVDSQITTYSSKVSNNERVNGSSNSSDFSKALVIGENSSNIMENVNSESSIVNLGNQPLGNIFTQTGGIDVGGAPVIISQGQVAFLGSYSGNNSIPISQIPSSLFASTLLGQREKFDDYTLFFGGLIVVNAQTWFGNDIAKTVSSDARDGKSVIAGTFSGTGRNVYITCANLYFLLNLGHYVTAQFDFDTNESGSFGLGNAFVIFGNLDTSPFFVTVGRNKLSFGNFGGGAYASSVKSFLSPGQVSNVSIDYKDEVWNTNVAVFGSNNKKANVSTGLFYADAWTQEWSGGFNVGYIFNIAGAGNSQLNQAMKNLNKNNNNVGVFNVDGNVAYTGLGGILQFQSGWTTTTNKENFNGNGVSLSTSTDIDGIVNEGSAAYAGAWYVACTYGRILGGRSTSFAVTYGETYNAAIVPMSIASSLINFGGSTDSGIKKQFIFYVNRAYFDDNVVFGPEYTYQELYSGQHMNTLTLNMQIYI